jgi:hypothetical protein
MHLALLILSFIILILIYKVGFNHNMSKKDDDLLVQNYHLKPSFEKKVILIIESFDNIKNLLSFIRNILKQTIKVNSIILISELKWHQYSLIYNTCITNNIGGLSIVLKESSNDTIILYVFSEAFYAFYNPNFLEKLLKTQLNVQGIYLVETNKIKVDINKVYE